MKKLVFFAAFILLAYPLFSQKVPVYVVINRNASPEWQILDENMSIVFQSNSFFTGDTISFSLEANKRYFFYYTVTPVKEDTVNLYCLVLDKEPLILVRSDDSAGDHIIQFFTGTRSFETKITGGTDALISEFPWQVYITAGEFTCGGSIISPEWIITAAHCVRNDAGVIIPAAQIRVKAGANNPYNNAEGAVYQAAQVISHENYNDETLENDIALIKVSNPINISQSRPVVMVTQEDISFGATDPGVMTWVTGWGLTSVSPEVFPTRLQKVQLPIVTNSQASTVWRSIPSTVLMAGFRNGNKDACSGDSGGPLVVPVLGEYRLAGLVSWGSSECNTYGAYTRISLFESWIRRHTGISALQKPPVPSGDTIICQGQLSENYTVAAVPGISGSEWKLLPEAAGTITGNATTAGVLWNPSFTGKATLTYRVISNGVYSDWSRLEINVVKNTRFIRQSADTALCTGRPVTITIVAEGYNLVYRWYRNGVLFNTGTSGSMTFTSTRPEDSGLYQVEISGACGSTRSGLISLTIYPLTNILSVSPDVTVPFGNNTTLEVEAAGHNLTYQWEKDSVSIAGLTDSVFIIEDANAPDIGLYRVTVKGTCGTETSDDVYLFVEGAPQAGGPDVFLWPSVVSSTFNIAVSGDEIYYVNIYNMYGQLVASFRGLTYQNTLDISGLAGGTYYVTVYNSKFRKTLRIIKL